MKVAMSRIHGLGQTDLSAGFAYTATTPQTGSANNLSSGFSYVCDPTDLSCQLNQLPVETTTPAALQTQVLNAALAPGTVALSSPQFRFGDWDCGSGGVWALDSDETMNCSFYLRRDFVGTARAVCGSRSCKRIRRFYRCLTGGKA